MNSVMYTPSRDAMDRHQYGVTKHRRTSSTGGNRAWSEEEEAYLLQTRMQKMPYKHIAAHLKKTELACRLHYHQISHGSNRRKRNASCSSVPLDRSPIILEGSVLQTNPSNRLSPVATPEGSVSRASTPPGQRVRLPSIASTTSSPKLPTILPKPTAMSAYPGGDITPGGYSTVSSNGQGMYPSSGSFQDRPSQKQLPRLDTSLPPLSSAPAQHRADHVDLGRLQAVYAAHKANFWGKVAHEYGPSATPAALEQAWKSGMCCGGNGRQGGSPMMTPSTSPVDSNRGVFSSRPQDKTSISAILGRDAEPRSAWDRDMVRRVEEERR